MPFFTTTLKRSARKAPVEHASKSASPEPWLSQRTKKLPDLSVIPHHEVFTFDVDPLGVKHVGEVTYSPTQSNTWDPLFAANASIVVKVVFNQQGAGELIINLSNT